MSVDILKLVSKVDIPRLITTVATVVGLVERVFRKKGSGPKKRKKALRALTRMLPGDVPPEVVDVLGVMVDAIGRHAGYNNGTMQILDVWDLTTDAVELVSTYVDDPKELESIVVEMLNDEIDLPLLGEFQEKLLISALVAAAIKALDSNDDDDNIPF